MLLNQENRLSHLAELPKDVEGYKTCIYLIALEGWRRGLNLEFSLKSASVISQGISFKLSDNNNSHTFRVSRGDLVSKNSVKICQNKQRTYRYLKEANVPIPEGLFFAKEISNEEILSEASNLGYPLVLKPTNAGGGQGVIVNIQSVEELNKSLIYVREELKYKEVILERLIEGDDYRVYVIKNEVIGIYKRIPANVIGDGRSTVKELIEKKNILRQENPFIRSRILKVDQKMVDFLRQQDLSLKSIIPTGIRVFLRSQGENLRERDPIDITDVVSNKVKNIAIKALNAIPGLVHGNVDMLICSKTGEGFVNEINSRPQISNHVFPLEGKARDVPKAIIDLYFPETKLIKINSDYYFDFNLIYEAYLNNSISKVSISKLPFNHVVLV